jgi:hypothetical protein
MNGGGKPMRAPWPGLTLLTVSTVLVMLATLGPADSTGAGPVCPFVCGPRGVADYLANLVLFLPFGASLGVLGLRGRRILIAGLLCSLAIEAAQLWMVSGRDANAADVVSNSLGAVLGGLIGGSWRQWLLPAREAAARYLALAAAGLAVVIVLTGLLGSPAPAGGEHELRIRARGSAYEPYPGFVGVPRVGEIVVPMGASVPDTAWTLLRGGVPLRVEIEPVPRAGGLRHILSLSAGSEDALFLAAAGDDLLLRYRTRAAGLWLDQPTMRLSGALTDAASGRLLEVSVVAGRSGYCIGAGRGRSCSEVTVASGWMLVSGAVYPTPWVRDVLSRTWLTLLVFPLGLWTRRTSRSLLLLIAAAILIAAAPSVLPFAALGVEEAAAGVAGWLAGVLAHRLTARGQPRGGPVAPLRQSLR